MSGQLTLLFGAHAAGVISAVAVLIALIAHGVMPWLPPATAINPFWYRLIYTALRYAAGNYGNAAPPQK